MNLTNDEHHRVGGFPAEISEIECVVRLAGDNSGCRLIPHINISELEGRVIVEVYRSDNQRIYFLTDTHEVFLLSPHPDIEIPAIIEDICGGLSDLLGVILTASCTSYESIDVDSTTLDWTSYNISTIRGSVTIVWCARRNGCYSKAVSFSRVGDARAFKKLSRKTR